MLMVQTAVRTLQESNVTDPVTFMDLLNRTIYNNIERIKTDKNMTLALLDYHQGKLSLSGQHEEVIMRASGDVERKSRKGVVRFSRCGSAVHRIPPKRLKFGY